jgi:hypothetical protein
VWRVQAVQKIGILYVQWFVVGSNGIIADFQGCPALLRPYLLEKSDFKLCTRTATVKKNVMLVRSQ